MRPPETVTAEPTERLAPTGSRLPVWYRLPDEPPLAAYPDQPRPDDDTVERPATAGEPVAAAVATDPSYPAPPDPGQVDAYPGTRLAPAPAAGSRRGSWFQAIVAGLVGAALALAGAAVIGDDDTAPDDSDRRRGDTERRTRPGRALDRGQRRHRRRGPAIDRHRDGGQRLRRRAWTPSAPARA